MSNNPLRVWLQQSRYWGQGKEGKVSHLFFDGGIACVPDDMCSTFGNVMCNAMARGHPQFAIEQKSPIFKLFMDLDLRVDEDLSEVQMRFVVNFIREKVNAFYMGNYDVIVCTRPAKHENKQEYKIKTGIHLVWQKLYTDADDAILFRKQLVIDCHSHFGSIFKNEWVDVIDISVYKKNGFRMIGCLKPGDPSMYTPTWEVRGKGDWDPLVEGISKEMVRLTSIRYFGYDKTTTAESGQARSGRDCADEDAIIYKQHKGFTRVDIGPIREELDMIKKRIVTDIHPKYADSQFTTVLKTVDGGYFLVCNSHYCLNKKGFHGTSNVYFLVTRDGIWQKCYSKKIQKPQGAKVTCNKFWGCRAVLPFELLQKGAIMFDYVDPLSTLFML